MLNLIKGTDKSALTTKYKAIMEKPNINVLTAKEATRWDPTCVRTFITGYNAYTERTKRRADDKLTMSVHHAPVIQILTDLLHVTMVSQYSIHLTKIMYYKSALITDTQSLSSLTINYW